MFVFIIKSGLESPDSKQFELLKSGFAQKLRVGEIRVWASGFRV
jgi:hypothetical protein